MAKETDGFLSAEEAVQSLLKNLKQLKLETEGYDKARSTLEDTREQLAALSGKIGILADQSRLVIESLRKIGTTEILRQLEELITTNQTLEKKIDGLYPTIEAVNLSISKQSESVSVNQGAIMKAIEIAGSTTSAKLAGLLNELQTRTKKILLTLMIALPLVTALLITWISLKK